MCLILFSYMNHSRYKLIMASNRDEFYERPTRQLSFWPENPDILAGRDERNLGTWLGTSRNGKIAAITNFRNLQAIKSDGPSRGLLVSDYLQGHSYPRDYLETIKPNAKSYSGFNLLLGDQNGLFYYSNMGESVQEVESGIHGLSNAFLDTPWPKVERGKRFLADAIGRNDEVSADDLFQLLSDTQHPPDHQLPGTGIGLEWERLLSPLFIKSPTYGTRSSAVILMDYDGRITFIERTYGAEKIEIVRFEVLVPIE